MRARFRDRARDSFMKAVSALHRGVVRATRGRVGGSLGSMPTVELITTGRTSGARRSTMLTAPVHDGDTFVIVASKGGDDRQPQWYLNLVATPTVELVVHGVARPYLARTVSADEKAELWPRIVAAYSGYAAYQRKTTRDIPVVLCEPRE